MNEHSATLPNKTHFCENLRIFETQNNEFKKGNHNNHIVYPGNLIWGPLIQLHRQI